MSYHTFLLYLATWSLVALTPGPAVMCAMTQATRHGFRASLTGVMGIQVGNLLFFACIALGLTTLLAAASNAFTMLRIVGAAYLFYLGVRIIYSTLRRPCSPELTTTSASPGRQSLFLQGLLIQITNPKALLFVSALLPQFIHPDRPVLWQIIVLVITTIAVDSVVLSSYAYFAERGIRSFRASRVAVWLERTFGTALVLFGIRLLRSEK